MTEAQQSMWLSKRPVEELYHAGTDPDETKNLVADAKFEQVLLELRDKNREMILGNRKSSRTYVTNIP